MSWDWESMGLTEWLGNLHDIPYLTKHIVGVISIAVAGFCGAVVGFERERREKPAGLRTLILISVGATIFTMASLLISEGFADPGRIAAQVVTGIGFLGAGAIIHIHDRGSVVGLTTGATIWTVAAIGVVIGIGYAAAGLVLSLLIFLILTVLRFWEDRLIGSCHSVKTLVHYRSERGKTRQVIIGILDANKISPNAFRFPRPEEAPPDREKECVEISYCDQHRFHRSFLSEIASLGAVEAIEELKS